MELDTTSYSVSTSVLGESAFKAGASLSMSTMKFQTTLKNQKNNFMKNLISIISILLIISCNNNKDYESIKIVPSNIKEISIANKVNCSLHNLKPITLEIIDKSEISKIINVFSLSKKIQGSVNNRANNGSFEISFNDDKTDYYFSLSYTVYDGVILRNNNNGEQYKNDMLEGLIYPLFVDNKIE